MLIKWRSRRFGRSSSGSKLNGGKGAHGDGPGGSFNGGDIKWELRPGGMLVQRRDDGGSSNGEGVIRVRVSTGTQLHDISIEPTSTFGKLSSKLLVFLWQC